MEAFAVTNNGTENCCAAEIKELLGADSETANGIVLFNAAKYQDICRLAYAGQSIWRTGELLGKFKFRENFFDSLAGHIAKSGIRDWIKPETSFRAECIRRGNHDFSSVDVEKAAGEAALESPGEKLKVDLKNPDVRLLIYISGNECYFGIDFAGIDLSSRDYKIFAHRDSLNGTVAYAMVRLAGWDKKGGLLDPFCGGGTIPIEAAFYRTGVAINHFRKDKLAFARMELGFDQKKFFEEIDGKSKFPAKVNVFGSDALLAAVNASNKNAKIAGIHKGLVLNRIDIEWLDTKFKESSIDFIVTDLPEKTRMSNAKYLDKIYSEFWFQLDFVMKKDGAVVVVACNTFDDMKKDAGKFKFVLDKQFDIWQGKERLLVGRFVR
ncbi:hypothetical protein J4227_03120 [Candidatus Woesearchaeota archaeon]|nr:hypothetical protein [Candidatus Woesearchaeota archaeon]